VRRTLLRKYSSIRRFEFKYTLARPGPVPDCVLPRRRRPAHDNQVPPLPLSMSAHDLFKRHRQTGACGAPFNGRWRARLHIAAQWHGRGPRFSSRISGHVPHAHPALADSRNTVETHRAKTPASVGGVGRLFLMSAPAQHDRTCRRHRPMPSGFVDYPRWLVTLPPRVGYPSSFRPGSNNTAQAKMAIHRRISCVL